MKINFIFLFFVSSVSFAGGGSIVRSGGGLGEMSAVMIFQNMDRYLYSCLQNTSACRLNEQETLILKKTSSDMKTEHQAYPLSFFAKSDGPDVLTENFVGSPIAIRSGALADSAGVPYSFSRIGSLVLYGLLRHQGLESKNFPPNLASDLAVKIFLPLKTEVTTLRINSNSSLVHWIKIETTSHEVFDEIVLEQPASSFDLYPLIQSVKLCENSKSLKLRIRRLILPNPVSETILLDVNWNCGGLSFGQAKIEIEFSFTPFQIFDPSTSRARAFSVVKP